MKVINITRNNKGLIIKFDPHSVSYDKNEIQYTGNELIISNEVLYELHKAFRVEVEMTELGIIEYKVTFEDK